MAVGRRSYLELAVDMALSLREHTRLPIALVTDERLRDRTASLHPRVFDRVTLLPRRFRSGHARKYGSAAASPFEETVFVDADCIVLGSLDGIFDVLRAHPMAMLGEYLTREDDRRHHGFSTRQLMDRFGLDTYLKSNSGIFAFRRPEALEILEACLACYRDEINPRLRWEALFGRWVGDEIAFGVVGGRRGLGLIPPPGPMFWPEEFPALNLDRPLRPLLHLIHTPPASVAAAVLARAARLRREAGLQESGLAHLRRELTRR